MIAPKITPRTVALIPFPPPPLEFDGQIALWSNIQRQLHNLCMNKRLAEAVCCFVGADFPHSLTRDPR